MENVEIDGVSRRYWMFYIVLTYIIGCLLFLAYIIVDFFIWDEIDPGLYYNDDISYQMGVMFFWPLVSVGSFIAIFTIERGQFSCMYASTYCFRTVQYMILMPIVTIVPTALFIILTILKRNYFKEVYIEKNRYYYLIGLYPVIGILLAEGVGVLEHYFFPPKNYALTLQEKLIHNFLLTQYLWGWNIFFLCFLIYIVLVLKGKMSKLELALILVGFTISYFFLNIIFTLMLYPVP